MPYEKNTNYVNIPFCSESHRGDFYTYSDIGDLILKSEVNKDSCFKCRTIGVLQSWSDGKEGQTEKDIKSFLLIKLPISSSNESIIRVSMKYLKASAEPTFIPYAVQIFGVLQSKQKPVIFANFLQVMNPAMAIRLRDTLSSVTRVHLAQIPFENDSKN